MAQVQFSLVVLQQADAMEARSAKSPLRKGG